MGAQGAERRVAGHVGDEEELEAAKKSPGVDSALLRRAGYGADFSIFRVYSPW